MQRSVIVRWDLYAAFLRAVVRLCCHIVHSAVDLLSDGNLQGHLPVLRGEIMDSECVPRCILVIDCYNHLT